MPAALLEHSSFTSFFKTVWVKRRTQLTRWRDAHGSSSFSTKTTPHVFCQPVVIVHTPILGRSGPQHQRMTTKYHITAYIIWIHMNHMDMELTSRNPSSFMNVEGGSLQIRVWMWFLIYSRYFPIQSIQSSRAPESPGHGQSLDTLVGNFEILPWSINQQHIDFTEIQYCLQV